MRATGLLRYLNSEDVLPPAPSKMRDFNLLTGVTEINTTRAAIATEIHIPELDLPSEEGHTENGDLD